MNTKNGLKNVIKLVENDTLCLAKFRNRKKWNHNKENENDYVTLCFTPNYNIVHLVTVTGITRRLS